MHKYQLIREIPTQYLPEREAAVYLGMRSHRSLQNMRWRGDGPAFCKRGVRVFYRQVDLEEWLQEKSVRKTKNSDAGVPLSDI